MPTHPIKAGVVSTIPVRLYGPSGRAIAHALVDTGATYTMFPPTLLAAIGLTPSSEQTIKIITASSVEYVPILKLKALELMGKRIEGVYVVSHHLPPGMPAQGLVGVNALGHFCVTFDYPNGILRIE